LQAARRRTSASKLKFARSGKFLTLGTSDGPGASIFLAELANNNDFSACDLSLFRREGGTSVFDTVHNPVHILCVFPDEPTNPRVIRDGRWNSIGVGILCTRTLDGAIVDERFLDAQGAIESGVAPSSLPPFLNAFLAYLRRCRVPGHMPDLHLIQNII
jgi:hypothetical protein